MSYLGNIFTSIKTVYEGMTITFSHLFREPMTIQYPDRIPRPIQETLPMRYRGFLEVDMAICTGCTLCQKACPIDCILIEAGKDPELGRVMTRFGVDLSKCMYCGLCTEPCPTGAIRFTREFEGSTYDIKTLLAEFIQEGEKVKPYKVVKKK